MALKIIFLSLLAYYAVVLWRYYLPDLRPLPGKPDGETDTDDEAEEEGTESCTVIGKSTYRPLPETGIHGLTNRHDGKGTAGAEDTERTATGAPEEGQAAEAPTETGALPDDDTDYSDIEPEEDEEAEEETYVPTPEEIGEEEEPAACCPGGDPGLATGYSFEDLQKVHRAIARDDANEEEKRQAREALPSVMGSDVWEEMLDAIEGAQRRVARLMEAHPAGE